MHELKKCYYGNFNENNVLQENHDDPPFMCVFKSQKKAEDARIRGEKTRRLVILTDED